MINIIIDEETHTVQDMVYCLQEVIRELEKGIVRGYGPDWHYEGTEETEETED